MFQLFDVILRYNTIRRNNMSSISLQATQNEIIRQVLNTQDIHFLDKIKNLFLKREADEACMSEKSLLPNSAMPLKNWKPIEKENLS